MVPIDILSSVYVLFGTFRGRRRGVPEELYRLVRTGLAFLSGLGLYGLVQSTMQTIPGFAGAAGFALSYAGVFVLLRKTRKAIRDRLHRTFGEARSLIAAAVGAARSILHTLVFYVTTVLADSETIDRLLLTGSIPAGILDKFL